ncbi:MAG: FHA domain-containing protein [Planctomycetota bacterium]|nr:FHA domain-containing protein [Planctomycetota bacterium]
MAILRINKMEKVGKQSLPDGPLTIGRSMKNDMCLPHPSVSRHHCVIENIEGKPTVRDLDSRHGTTVNGKSIDESILHDGDIVGLGIFEIIYCDANAPRDDGSDHDFDLEILSEESDSTRNEHENESTGVVSIAPADRIERTSDKKSEELREQVTTLQMQLDAQQAQLDEANHNLDLAHTALQDKVDELEQANQSLQDRDEQLEASRSEVETLHAIHESDVDSVRSELNTAHDSAEKEQARADELESKLARHTEEALEQLKSFEHQRAEYDERIKRHESQGDDLRKQLGTAEKELQAKTEKLNNAMEQLVALKDESKSYKSQLAELRQKMHEVFPYLEKLSTTAQHVMRLLQQLATVRKNVHTLETAYVQANQWVDEAEAVGADNYAEMIEQREDVGEQLETAHGQFDSSITELQQASTQFCQYILSDPVRDALAGSTKRGFFSRLVKQ